MKKTILFVLLLTQFIWGETMKRAITPEDLWSMKRIGSAVFAEKFVFFEETNYDIEKNQGETSIHGFNPESGESFVKIENASTPIYNNGGIYFMKEFDKKNWLCRYSLKNGNIEKIYQPPVDISNQTISYNGEWLIFTAHLYGNSTTLAESAVQKKMIDENPVTAKEIIKLPYRLWSSWVNHYRSQVFAISLKNLEQDPIALSPDAEYVPPLDLGGSVDLTISPDNRLAAFVTNMDADLARSTNNDIFIVDLKDILSDNDKILKISDNPANDNNPVFSPDGEKIAYLSMKRPGFEADQYDLIIYNLKTKERKNFTEDYDLCFTNPMWSPKGDVIWGNVLKNGRIMICSVNLSDGKITEVIKDNYNTLLEVGDNSLLFKKQKSNMPYELFLYNIQEDKIVQLTRMNHERLSQLEMNEIEDFYFTSFDGKKVHGLLLKPPFFDDQKKYPLIYLIHGGPQGAWEDDFHYRWNYQLFASRGYVVAMVNFRGSKGYGQDFCDEVSKNWGGGPFQDVILGLDSLFAQFSFIDSTKVSAAGASYGGYMINWIAVQPESAKFNCLISHAGVYDLFAEYGTTEELWFPEWEMGGNPYENPALYVKWSPSLLAKNLMKYKTPTLVVHGAKDYRVPISQGMQLFTALQTYQVPSKFIYFPDENHFVLKPQNAIYWWNTCLNWIDQWNH